MIFILNGPLLGESVIVLQSERGRAATQQYDQIVFTAFMPQVSDRGSFFQSDYIAAGKFCDDIIFRLNSNRKDKYLRLLRLPADHCLLHHSGYRSQHTLQCYRRRQFR